MFLRNYDNYWAAMHLFSTTTSSSYGSTAEFGDGFINQRTANGAIEAVQVCTASYSNTFYPPLNLTITGICLGDGNTPVTYDDYQLAGNVITNKLVLENSSESYDSESQQLIKELTCTYYNNGQNNVTIQEWGLFRGNPGSSSLTFSNTSADSVLMYREVLADPIIISPGETATLVFSIKIPTDLR